MTTVSPLFWIGFLSVILTLLLLDLFVFHRKPHEVKTGEATKWVIFWVSLAAVFNVFVYFEFGAAKALEFTTGYLIEEALSVDNVFVFLVLFKYFHVPKELQHRVLFFGILGAIILRGIFILAGAALIAEFHWVIYIFGAFLVFTGVKLVIQDDVEVHPERNPALKLLRRIVPMTSDYRGPKFFVKEAGKRLATPLLAVLVVVEATDVVFAVDSIPAIFGVTHDPFIVYTSNIFAILGLRALFMLLAGIMDKFRFLKYGLGLVLVFVGCKMLISGWYHVPIGISLSVVVLLLGGSVLLSFLYPAPPPELLTEPDEGEHGFSMKPDSRRDSTC
ncbi:MAG: TerC/Alx family metal homeostasis membrane protein [candidate division Zixibacteria bacterium]|nr:TerC/Alx family metal homeostasis membrane protein [candidate division Zixibacteria bacterium]